MVLTWPSNYAPMDLPYKEVGTNLDRLEAFESVRSRLRIFEPDGYRWYWIVEVMNDFNKVYSGLVGFNKILFKNLLSPFV